MSASQVPVTYIDIGEEIVTTSTNTTSQFSEIVDIQIPEGYKYEFPAGKGISMYVRTHETATVTTDSGTETVSLSNDLVNSPTVRDIPGSSGSSSTGDQSNTSTSGAYSLVVWDDQSDIQTGVESVNYSGDSFDYTTPDTTDRDLEIFYLWGDPSQLEFRTYTGTEEEFDKKAITTMRELHLADVYLRQEQVTFSESFTLREDEHLKVHVNTGVDLSNWDAQPGDGSSSTPGDFETYGYSNFQIPVRRIPLRA